MAITPKGTEGSVDFGLCNVMIASVTETVNTTTGKLETSYGTPKAWAGAVHMTLNTKGSITDTYADNGVWYTAVSNPGYDGSYECMHVLEWVATDLLGRNLDNNGAIIESTEDRPKYFALMFETDTDTEPTRYVFYKCMIQPINGDWETKTDATNPKSHTATIKIMPRADEDTINSKKVHAIGATLSATADGTAYDGFFSQVYEPTTT